MADISGKLRIKYGLRDNPSQLQITEWARRTREFQLAGVKSEDAGNRAAALVFRDYKTHFYASEADVIEMLLAEVEKK